LTQVVVFRDENKDPDMNIARASLKLFSANIGSAVIQFLAIAYFARELGAATIGVYFLFEALLGLLTIPADFGLRGAVEKRISEGRSEKRYLSCALLLKIAPVSFIFLLILFLGPAINSYLGADASVFLAVALVLQESALLSEAVLKGEHRVGETASLRITRYVIWAIAGIAFVFFGYGAKGLIYAMLIGLFSMSIYGWLKVDTRFGRPSKGHATSLLNYGKYNVVSSIGGYVYNWMDVAIIGFFLTQSYVGAYEVAWKVSAVVVLLSRSIAAAVFPKISGLHAGGDRKKIEDLLPKALVPSLAFVIPSFIGGAIFSKQLLRYVFGGEYVIAWLVLIILLINSISESFQVVVGKSLQAVDRPNLAAKATLVTIFLNLALNIILIQQFGIIGAATATTVSSIIGILLHTIYLSDIISVEIPVRELAECAIASACMGVVLIATTHWVAVDSLLTLSLLVFQGAIFYMIFVFLMPNLRTRIVQDGLQRLPR
jgi:O-antigen/teichoic acid export membrane protein